MWDVPLCIAEMPALKRLVEEYKDAGIIFLGVTLNDNATLRKRFLPKHRFDFVIIPDAQNIEDLFGVVVPPTIFMFDQSGKL
ncbi:MAG TPA: TlpA disulfide reductase family protein [Chitinophagaceae bacterium]|nr:TlpA disulfide reductase family protein [Chitinophagaceae bacterium]